MKTIVIPVLFCLFFSSISFAEEIRVMYNGDYYPLEFTNDLGQPDGFVIDLIYVLAREAALEVSFVEGNWKQRDNMLFNGFTDLTPGYEYRSGNESIISSKTLFSVPFSLIYRSELKPASLKYLNRGIPIYSSGDSSELLLTSLLKSEDLIRTKSWTDAIKALNVGYGDYTIVASLHRHLIIEEYEPDLSTFADFRLELPYVLYSTTWNKVPLEKINNALSIIKASGEYDRIYRKWFEAIPESLVTEPEENRSNLFILFIAAIVFIIVMITIKKRKVNS